MYTARFLKYVWPFFNILHERVIKKFNFNFCIFALAIELFSNNVIVAFDYLNADNKYSIYDGTFGENNKLDFWLVWVYKFYCWILKGFLPQGDFLETHSTFAFPESCVWNSVSVFYSIVFRLDWKKWIVLQISSKII